MPAGDPKYPDVRWRPSADLAALRARAALLAHIRRFFETRNVLEVETPLLCSAGVTDPALEPFVVGDDSPIAPAATPNLTASDGLRYLQTSPEYAMKRLLAAGVGDCYQLGKAFRAGEVGRRHNPEYTLLEWYRLGFDHYQLLRETAELVVSVLNRPSWQIWPWGALFQQFLQLDPYRVSVATLTEAAAQAVGPLPDGLDRDGLLDLLMSHVIEPGISSWGVVFVLDYPASQAALAKRIERGGIPVGARFECYVDGIEVANGYWESADAEDMRARFHEDNTIRTRRGLTPKPLDEHLLSAMSAGLPECAGVALGVDRLLMLQLGASALADTMSFDWSRS